MICKLDYIGFIDPHFFRSLPVTALVSNDGVIRIGTNELRFVSNSFPVDTNVKIWISGGDFVCQDVAEIESERKRLELLRFEQQIIAEQKEAARQQEAIRFNQSLKIPVPWYSDIKPVLSGLTENSMGNGCKSNTVFHVVLCKDLDVGRLHRLAGQPLCSANMGKFGDLVGWHEGQQDQYKVTCKRCLEIAKKFTEA